MSAIKHCGYAQDGKEEEITYLTSRDKMLNRTCWCVCVRAHVFLNILYSFIIRQSYAFLKYCSRLSRVQHSLKAAHDLGHKLVFEFCARLKLHAFTKAHDSQEVTSAIPFLFDE